MVPMFSKKGAPIYKYTQWEKFLQKILEISKFTFTIAWESMSMRLCCAISRQPEMTLDAYIVTLAADRVAFAGAWHGILYISFH